MNPNNEMDRKRAEIEDLAGIFLFYGDGQSGESISKEPVKNNDYDSGGPLWYEVSESTLEKIAQKSYKVTYVPTDIEIPGRLCTFPFKKGHILYSQADQEPNETIFFTIKGSVLIRGVWGNRITHWRIAKPMEPSSHFGELEAEHRKPFFGSKANLATARTMGETTVLIEILGKDYFPIEENDPALSRNMRRLWGLRTIERVNERGVDLHAQNAPDEDYSDTAKNNLVHFLYTLMEDVGVDSEGYLQAKISSEEFQRITGVSMSKTIQTKKSLVYAGFEIEQRKRIQRIRYIGKNSTCS